MIRLDSRTIRRLTMVVLGLFVAACGSNEGTAGPSAGTAVLANPSTPDLTGAASTTPSAAASPTDAPFDPAAISLSVRVIVDGLNDPVDVATPGDGSGRIFVVEQPGRIRIVQNDRLQAQPFLDIRARIASGGERGLLGLAFHPDFPTDPRLFVDYTDVNGNTVVAEYRLDAEDEDAADRDSERILIRIDQPYANHNGGAVVFGPDGMLYVSSGDGGSGGDPQGNGRRLDTLLAKVLRVDVDGQPQSADKPYGIPDDNPFLGVAGAMPEIWLTGLRNPWRMRFDGETGNLWVGDVGQGAWEEIDMAPAGTGGLDFGWNVMEGFHCYDLGSGCDLSGLTLPVAEYGHDLGCAVIGGVVVRDPGQPLNGSYVFSDSCSGNIWRLDSAGSGSQEPALVKATGRSISSIALDDDGAILATDLGSGELVEITATAR